MSTHHDGCRKSLTVPIIGLGAVIFLMSALRCLWFWCIVSFLLNIFCQCIVFYHISVLCRSVVGFLGALKNNSILLWIVSLFLIWCIIFKMAKSDKERKKIWILGIILDTVLAVSDHVVLCLGGNPGLHSIGVSMQIGWQCKSFHIIICFLCKCKLSLPCFCLESYILVMKRSLIESDLSICINKP